MEFILEASDETLSTHSGLGLIGLLLSKTNVYERLSHIHLPIIKTLPFISNGDIIHSYLGLLCQSKNDFDHINPFRDDPFFYRALDIKKVPSSSTLRQRMNQIATKREDWKPILLEESVDLIKQFDSPITPTILSDGHTAYAPLDLDPAFPKIYNEDLAGDQ